MGIKVTDYYPKYDEYWFLGRVVLESGYSVFTFKSTPNELIKLLKFCNTTEKNSFWNESGYYGKVEIYLKESFATRTEAINYGTKIAKDKKLNDLIWNHFPDPWEDK